MDKIWEILFYLGTTRWYWLAYIVPSIVLLIMFMNKNKIEIYDFLVKLLIFVSDSLKTDNKPDATKIIAFVVTNFAFIPVALFCAYSIKDPLHLVLLVTVIATFILVLLRIVLPAHLIELKNGKEVKADQ
jgi:hypothetical protein